MISESQKLPNSLRLHPVERGSSIWIGYITVSNQHWRILISWRDDNVVLLRLFDHVTMNRYLSNRIYAEEFSEA